MLREALPGLLRVGFGEVAFIDRHHDRTACRLRVLDRLDRLRHRAFGRCDHQHDQIRHRRAPGTHRGKGGVAGRIDEGEALAARLDLIGADVLGDPARFALGHLGLTNRVEQRGFAMVDMAHHRDDGRAGDRVFRRFRFLCNRRVEEFRLLEADVDGLEAHLSGDAFDGLEVDPLIDRDHDAERHQLALDGGRLQARLLRQLADADVAFDLDHPGLARCHRR